MGLFGKKNSNLGFETMKKVYPVKIKKNRAISKMLNYQFVLPEGFEFTKDSGKAYFDGNSYIEFKAEKGTTFIIVLITPSDGDEVKKRWHQVSDRIHIAILEKMFRSIEAPGIEFVDFLGYRCAHCTGVFARNNKYVEEYLYAAPYCTVDFMVVADSQFDLPDRGLNYYFK